VAVGDSGTDGVRDHIAPLMPDAKLDLSGSGLWGALKYVSWRDGTGRAQEGTERKEVKGMHRVAIGRK
jgi:hypothetical protein